MIKYILNTILLLSIINISASEQLSSKETKEIEAIATSITIKVNVDEEYNDAEKIEALKNNKNLFKLSKTIWFYKPDIHIYKVPEFTAKPLNWTYLKEVFDTEWVDKITTVAQDKLNHFYHYHANIDITNYYYIKSVSGILIEATIDGLQNYFLLLHHNDDFWFGLIKNENQKNAIKRLENNWFGFDYNSLNDYFDQQYIDKLKLIFGPQNSHCSIQ